MNKGSPSSLQKVVVNSTKKMEGTSSSHGGTTPSMAQYVNCTDLSTRPGDLRLCLRSTQTYKGGSWHCWILLSPSSSPHSISPKPLPSSSCDKPRKRTRAETSGTFLIDAVVSSWKRRLSTCFYTPKSMLFLVWETNYLGAWVMKGSKVHEGVFWIPSFLDLEPTYCEPTLNTCVSRTFLNWKRICT